MKIEDFTIREIISKNNLSAFDAINQACIDVQKTLKMNKPIYFLSDEGASAAFPFKALQLRLEFDLIVANRPDIKSSLSITKDFDATDPQSLKDIAIYAKKISPFAINDLRFSLCYTFEANNFSFDVRMSERQKKKLKPNKHLSPEQALLVACGSLEF